MRYSKEREPTLDLFAHLLAAGLVAEGLARARPHDLSLPTRALRGGAALGLGALSHLALDALPHFGFLPHVYAWTWMPHGWLVRPIVGGLFAFGFLVAKGRRNLGLVVTACVGATYPDVEKIACTIVELPVVVFRAHAEVTTTYTAGLPPKWLAASEIVLSLLFAVLYARLADARLADGRVGPKKRAPPPSSGGGA